MRRGTATWRFSSPLPLVFAYILAVLVHRNAAACCKGGFRQCEKFVGVFGHCACRICLFPPTCKKSCSLCESDALCVCFEIQVSHFRYLDTAFVCMKSTCRADEWHFYQISMAHKVITHEFVGLVCRPRPCDVTKANRPPSFKSSIALTKKVIVYGLPGSLLVYAAFLPEFRIEHNGSSERYVGGL